MESRDQSGASLTEAGSSKEPVFVVRALVEGMSAPALLVARIPSMRIMDAAIAFALAQVANGRTVRLGVRPAPGARAQSSSGQVPWSGVETAADLPGTLNPQVFGCPYGSSQGEANRLGKK